MNLYETTRSNEKEERARLLDPSEGVSVERVELQNGFRAFLEGHPYPHKGMPTFEAVQAVNVIKRLVRSLGWRVVFCRKTVEEVGMQVLSPYFMQEQYLTEIARELIHTLAPICGQNLAKVIGHVFEYDGAYRFRLMDLCSETSKRKLLEHPRTEIRRLLSLYGERDYPEVATKVQKMGKLLLVALLWPPFKAQFKEAIRHSDFKNMQFDEIDTYWAKQKIDYRYFGRGII